MNELLLYLYAESPVHAGAGDSLGVLDLPVQREATTGYPVIWGQSLKGALRQAAEEAARAQTGGWTEAMVKSVFGTASGDDGGEDNAGLLVVGDAQLVALPVPTLRRTFAWATSQLALGRLARKYAVLPDRGQPQPQPPLPIPSVVEAGGATCDQEWTKQGSEVLGPCLVEFGQQHSEELAAWANRLATDAVGQDPLFGHFAKKLREDLLLVGSSVMPMLLRECTELTARVQLNDGKTVEHGPFYSEYLPAETILAASLSLRPSRTTELTAANLAAVTELLHGTLVQIGGDETLGKGMVWTRLLGGGR